MLKQKSNILFEAYLRKNKTAIYLDKPIDWAIIDINMSFLKLFTLGEIERAERMITYY